MLTLKKPAVVICTLALLFVCTISPAYASNQGITPYMEHITNGQLCSEYPQFNCNCHSLVQGHTDTTKTQVEIELQEQFLLFFWNTVDTWSATNNDDYCIVTGSSKVTRR